MLSNILQYLKRKFTAAQEAMQAWDVRTEQSHQASGGQTVYDRYDPALGLHKEPKEENNVN